MIDRQDELRSGELQDMTGHVKLVGLNLALARRVALRLEKRVGHGAADQELVNFLEQGLDDQNLVGNFGSAHDGHIGTLGVAQERVEDLQFLLDQKANGPSVGGELLGRRNHGSLVAVASTEGVIDIGVRQGGHLLGERRVALLLTLVETHVLENHDLARGKVSASCLSLRPDGVVGLLDRTANQLSQAGGHRVQAERGVGGRVAGRTAQMADKDQAAAPVQDIIEGWQCRADPTIVGDVARFGLRDIEIDADEDFLTPYIQVANRSFWHRCTPESWRKSPDRPTPWVWPLRAGIAYPLDEMRGRLRERPAWRSARRCAPSRPTRCRTNQ